MSTTLSPTATSLWPERTTGAGIFDMVMPTNGSLLAILAAGGVRYEEWMAFAWRWYLVLTALGAVAVLIALGIGLE